MSTAVEQMLIEWEDATRQAYDALARYKFWMFGYHAARVVYISSVVNRMGGPKLANPFGSLVQLARGAYCRSCGEMKRERHTCTSASLDWQAPLDGALALESGEP